MKPLLTRLVRVALGAALFVACEPPKSDPVPGVQPATKPSPPAWLHGTWKCVPDVSDLLPCDDDHFIFTADSIRRGTPDTHADYWVYPLGGGRGTEARTSDTYTVTVELAAATSIHVWHRTAEGMIYVVNQRGLIHSDGEAQAFVKLPLRRPDRARRQLGKSWTPRARHRLTPLPHSCSGSKVTDALPAVVAYSINRDSVDRFGQLPLFFVRFGVIFAVRWRTDLAYDVAILIGNQNDSAVLSIVQVIESRLANSFPGTDPNVTFPKSDVFIDLVDLGPMTSSFSFVMRTISSDPRWM